MSQRNIMTTGFRAILIATAFPGFGPLETSGAETTSVIQAARRSAEELVGLLRAGKWEAAATNVVIFAGKHDSVTRQRMGIPKDASQDEMTRKAAAWFRSLYEVVRPGRVRDVRIDSKDQELVLVEYTHEDLDGFSMRCVDGKWYYTLE
jgi:hypothetical protein